MKRTVAEVLVPAVLRLYAHMRPRGGQLAAYLVRIATDLLNDYRHEVRSCPRANSFSLYTFLYIIRRQQAYDPPDALFLY